MTATMGERPDDHRGMDPQTTRQGRLLSGEGTPVKGRGARLDRLPLTAFGSKAGCGHLRRKGGNAMSFRGDGKVYLEVEVNEEVSKDENPNVPYGAEGTARDVVDCIQHGARVVRYHARATSDSETASDQRVAGRCSAVADRSLTWARRLSAAINAAAGSGERHNPEVVGDKSGA